MFSRILRKTPPTQRTGEAWGTLPTEYADGPREARHSSQRRGSAARPEYFV